MAGSEWEDEAGVTRQSACEADLLHLIRYPKIWLFYHRRVTCISLTWEKIYFPVSWDFQRETKVEMRLMMSRILPSNKTQLRDLLWCGEGGASWGPKD